MELVLILNEFVILIYIIMKYIKSGILNSTFNSTQILIVLLIYICFKMIFYIVNNKKLKNIIIITLLAYSIIISLYLNDLFIFFIPMNIFILTYYINVKKFIGFLASYMSLFIIKINYLEEYILITTTSYILYYFTCHMYEKVKKLREEKDILKEKNNSLYNTLDRKIDYEKQMKYMTGLEERNKIAQEIHDNIGHTISSTLLQLEAAKLLMTRDLEKSQRIIENTIEVLRKGMEDIRHTLRNIKPSSEQLGINRLVLLIEEFEVNSNMKVYLNYDVRVSNISHIQWKIILDNVNEALTNTIKYSKATTVSINIKILNKLIKVEVRDNGLGSNKIIKGLGAIGMEERAASIGGQVILDGSKGFSVIILLPIN